MIKLAIVGTGGVAHGHARHFKSLSGCRLVACCDVRHDRAAAFAATHQIPAAHCDIDAMFAQEALDAISNCTPDAFPAPLSLKAIAKGIHGDRGAIRINLDKSCSQLELCRSKNIDKAQWQTVACAKTPNLHQRFITSITTGTNAQPDFARGAAIQKVIDACCASDKTGRTVKT